MKIVYPVAAPAWYFAVPGAAGVWFSTSGGFVPVNDTAYLAWLKVPGNRPISLPSVSAAQALLAIWFPPAPTPAQQAAALLSGGLTIASTSTPVVNGLYSVSDTVQAHISAEMLAVLVTSAFCGGGTTVSWALANGSTITFPSIAVFQGFAVAVAAFVAGAQKVIDGVVGAALPSASVTIA